jgi:hypothetical protein
MTEPLREAWHLRGSRVLCDGTGRPLTQKIIQVLARADRQTSEREAGDSHPAAHILFALGNAWGASTTMGRAALVAGTSQGVDTSHVEPSVEGDDPRPARAPPRRLETLEHQSKTLLNSMPPGEGAHDEGCRRARRFLFRDSEFPFVFPPLWR